MYLIVIGVLSIVLAFPAPPFSLGLKDPKVVWTLVAPATVLPALLMAFVSRRTLRLLEQNPEKPGIGQAAYGFWLGTVQFLLAAMHGCLLLATDLLVLCPLQTVERAAEGRITDIQYAVPGVPGLIAVFPFLLSIFLLWIASYPAERAIRQIAVEYNAFSGKPIHPVWTLPQFLLFSFRHQVAFVLIPMVLILAARDLIQNHEAPIRGFLGQNAEAPSLVLGAAALLVAVISPALLRYIWSTEPLPDGPLRDRLLHLCDRLRMRCRDILVWRSGGMIVNAAVMGVVAPIRYVLITDGMLEQMDDTKIEAVFGHESGHVKRHHILYFLLFAMISGSMATVFLQYTRDIQREAPTVFQVATAAAGLALLVKWGVVFGWVSRRFERQADVFGVRTLALAGVPCAASCAVHSPETVPSADRGGQRDPLCRTAAHIFADTLHEVAVLNGIPPEQKSWRHGSIALRSRVLQELAADPAKAARFERGVRRMKAAILVTSVLSAAWAGWEIKVWTMLPGAKPAHAARPAARLADERPVHVAGDVDALQRQ